MIALHSRNELKHWLTMLDPHTTPSSPQHITATLLTTFKMQSLKNVQAIQWPSIVTLGNAEQPGR